jgi:hypothetical protein
MDKGKMDVEMLSNFSSLNTEFTVTNRMHNTDFGSAGETRV